MHKKSATILFVALGTSSLIATTALAAAPHSARTIGDRGRQLEVELTDQGFVRWKKHSSPEKNLKAPDARSRFNGSHGGVMVAGRTPLSNPQFGDMVVDELNQQVFVSGGPGGTWIDVLNLDGKIVTSIAAGGGTGMVLDGTSLYVARSGFGVIDEIDTTSLSKIGSLETTPHADPRLLAFAGGKLWFTYAEPACDPSCAGFGSIDPTDGLVTTYTGDGFPDITGEFETSPTDSNLLLVGGVDLGEGSTFYKYDVTSGTPELLISRPVEDSVLGIIELTPDGTTVLYRRNSVSNDVRALRVSDLSSTPVKYSADARIRINALDATSANGGFLAAGGSLSLLPGKSVALFPFGQERVESLHATAGRGDLCLRGLKFSEDGQRLFAVSASSYKRSCDEGPVFQVFEGAARFSSHASLTARPPRISYGRSVRLTAHLRQFAKTDNDILSILKKPHGGAKRLVKSARVNSEGDLSVRVSPKERTSYFAQWSGDDVFLPTSSSGELVRVEVITTTRLSGHYATDGQYKLFHAGDSVVQTGRVVPNHAGKPLMFIAQAFARGRWRTTDTASFRIRSNGTVAAAFEGVQGYRYRVKNVFAGDNDHLGDASPWLFLRVTG